MPYLYVFLTLLSIIGSCHFTWAAEVNFSWLANSEPDVVGYKLYYGDSSRNYNYKVDIGHEPVEGKIYGMISGLDNSQTYYFAVTAYTTTGEESGFSSEIVHCIECDNTVLETLITSGTDDAEEAVSSGWINLSSSDLEMIQDSDEQLVGLRFNNLDIPQDATVTKVWIQFTVDETTSDFTSLTIEGEYAGDAAPFTTSSYNISSRDRTISAVEWQPPAWSTTGASGSDQQTTDLKDIVQEIVSRADWTSNNSMVFIISGEGKRIAESYDGVASAAAVLHVEFSTGPDNQPPVINAGEDQSVALPADTAVLDGTVTDDGLPVDTLQSEWRHVGGTGMGSVTFADPYAVDTTVTFDDSGTYILELTADDGEFIRVDSITVTVMATAELIALTVTPDSVTVSAENTVQFSATGTDQNSNSFPVDADWESTCGTISSSGLYTAPSIAGECIVTASAGTVSNTATVTVTEEPVESTVLETLITSGTDDAEEAVSSGWINLSSSDLEMTQDSEEQLVGLRFNNLDIPQDATITKAWIQFTVDETTTDFTSLTIEGEYVADAAPFTTSSYNISSRERTLAAVEWQPSAWSTTGASGSDQQTTDIRDIVQEIVSLADWTGNNSMVFIISGEGKRVAESYDGVASAAAVLHVEFLTEEPFESTVTEAVITSGTDDAEEGVSSGGISLGSSDLEMVEETDEQLVGLRFNNLDIPQDATITKAWIQFTVDESTTDFTSLTIEGEYVGDAAPFTTSSYNISSRVRTISAVEWQPPAWSTTGASGPDQQTTDLKDIVQEIVSLADWASDNSMVFIINGEGKRVAESYDGVASAAAVLHVEFSTWL